MTSRVPPTSSKRPGTSKVHRGSPDRQDSQDSQDSQDNRQDSQDRTGQQGQQGPQGPAGPSGAVTVSSGASTDIIMYLAPSNDLGKLNSAPIPGMRTIRDTRRHK